MAACWRVRPHRRDEGWLTILPRKGEVSPKVTEGEDTEPKLPSASPSVWQVPATSPLRGRIRR
jgi:hypothetical protein